MAEEGVVGGGGTRTREEVRGREEAGKRVRRGVGV
jgi:hypothetical protein